MHARDRPMTAWAAAQMTKVLDSMAADRNNRVYHVDKWGDTWHFAYPGDRGMEPIWMFGEHQRLDEGVSAVAMAAQGWVAQVVHEKGAVANTATWRLGVPPHNGEDTERGGRG